jgi:hypothetical protein
MNYTSCYTYPVHLSSKYKFYVYFQLLHTAIFLLSYVFGLRVIANIWQPHSYKDISIYSPYLHKYRFPWIIKKLQTKRQKDWGETIEETAGCVRLERVNKWPNSKIATWWWWWRRWWWWWWRRRHTRHCLYVCSSMASWRWLYYVAETCRNVKIALCRRWK